MAWTHLTKWLCCAPGFKTEALKDLPISRTQIPEIMNFLKQAQQNFEAQDRARKQ